MNAHPAENDAAPIISPRDTGTPRLMYQAGRDGDWMKFAETFNAYMDRERAEAAYFAMWHFFLRLPHSPLSDMVQREAMRLREAIPARPIPPADAQGETCEECETTGRNCPLHESVIPPGSGAPEEQP